MNRPYDANEVFVTGTFDDWGKTVQLDRIGDGFEKEVPLPTTDEKVHYKVRPLLNALHMAFRHLDLLALGLVLFFSTTITSSDGPLDRARAAVLIIASAMTLPPGTDVMSPPVGEGVPPPLRLTVFPPNYKTLL